MQVQRAHNNNFNLIRLAAALQVLLVHACNHLEYQGPLVTALKVVPGVPAFFFISGYLIFASYDRMHANGVYGFFVNRVLRIYPALLACVLLSILAVWLTGYFAGRGVGMRQFVLWLLGQMTFFQFYNPAFMRDFGVGVLNGALWTISVELQFYVLVPALYWLIRRRPAAALALFAASIAINLFIRNYLQWDLLYIKLLYVSFTPWLFMFMLGCFAAAWPQARGWIDRPRLRYLVPAYVLSMILIGGYTQNASNAINPISVALLGLIILKIGTRELRAPRQLTRFVEKNDLSYGMYLYHMPIINLLLVLGWLSAGVDVMIVVAASLVAAALSWYVIERPALSHKR